MMRPAHDQSATVRPAEWCDMDVVRALFREYAASLSFDLCFQSFERELAELPGRYAHPTGCLLLAEAEGTPAGCVGLRDLGEGACEMKRLYVRPSHRGLGLGRLLCVRVREQAADMGYTCMRLDTVPSIMGRAVEMYRTLGFREIPAYCENPVPGAMFMECRLRPATPASGGR